MDDSVLSGIAYQAALEEGLRQEGIEGGTRDGIGFSELVLVRIWAKVVSETMSPDEHEAFKKLLPEQQRQYFKKRDFRNYLAFKKSVYAQQRTYIENFRSRQMSA